MIKKLKWLYEFIRQGVGKHFYNDAKKTTIKKVNKNSMSVNKDLFDHELNILLPNKEDILKEANEVYKEFNNSGEMEAVRQARTAQLMFIAGAYYGRALSKAHNYKKPTPTPTP